MNGDAIVAFVFGVTLAALVIFGLLNLSGGI